MDKLLPPSCTPASLGVAARDAELGHSKALSREDVLRRRRRRLVQLYSLYRARYWALVDELPSKIGEYWWEHGASPVLLEEPQPALPRPPHLEPALVNGAGVGGPVIGVCVGNLENGGVGAQTPAAAGMRAGCAAWKCEAKAMPLSRYCFNHILLDTKQVPALRLRFRKSGAPYGETTCGKPALRGITPLRCPDHNLKSQKLVTEGLKNARIDLPLICMSVPKLSFLISETVREIQMKRKLSLNDV